ncbi:MAG: hypothetical protein ACSHXY_14035, partial [Alphaproteobacteria bacterium]
LRQRNIEYGYHLLTALVENHTDCPAFLGHAAAGQPGVHGAHAPKEQKRNLQTLKETRRREGAFCAATQALLQP